MRSRMVDRLVQRGRLKSPAVERAMRTVARHAFLPGLGLASTYADEAVAIKWSGGRVISSVSQPFCGACSRARLSSEGKFYTCLFATQGLDLRAPLRGGASDADILQLIRGVWNGRSDRYSELREELRRVDPGAKKIEMNYIGG